MVIPYLV
jgi:hypothetical protein